MMVHATIHELEADEVFAAYQEAYSAYPDVILSRAEVGANRMTAEELLLSNKIHLKVSKLPFGGTTIVVSYDNLGKGSAAAAAENIRLMLA